MSLDRLLITEFPLFAGLAGNALDLILKPATTIRCATGSAIFEQGAPATRFFVLLHGRLRVTQITGEGQQVVVRIINPGDLFGITVSRVLAAWQRAGLVDVGRQQLVVCDAHRLMMIGDGHDPGLL